MQQGRRHPVIPGTIGTYIKAVDTLRMSPRDFLRIGKVQKEIEEPLTEAQQKHRDRAHVMTKLNKVVQHMMGEEAQ